MVRALLAAVAAGVATLAGVVSTPAFARSDEADRNVPCEPPPPSANTVASRQGTVGLQFTGIGITADRSRVGSRTDVIVGAEGSEGWFDMTMYLQACRAITLTWPDNPARQMEELFKVRDRLRKSAAEAKVANNAGAAAAASANPQKSSPQATDAAAAPEPRAGEASPAAEALKSALSARAPIAVPRPRASQPAATPVAPNPQEDSPADLTAALLTRATSVPQPAPPSNCAGNDGCAPEDAPPRSSTIPVTKTRSYSYNGENNCSPGTYGSGMIVGSCGATTIQTCTTSAPITLSSMPISIGSMILPGMPITISGGQTTCSTTTSF